MKRYFIRPIRKCTPEVEAAIYKIVGQLEADGDQVFVPGRDTVHPLEPQYEWEIALEHVEAVRHAGMVDVFYDPETRWSLFDFGVAVALRKPMTLWNRSTVGLALRVEGEINDVAAFIRGWDKACADLEAEEEQPTAEQRACRVPPPPPEGPPQIHRVP